MRKRKKKKNAPSKGGMAAWKATLRGDAQCLRAAVYARRGQAKRTFCAASSQMAFFWFLKARVAMWPLMAACWPMGGDAMGCSLPCTLRMKLRKGAKTPSSAWLTSLRPSERVLRLLMFSGAAAATSLAAQQGGNLTAPEKRTGRGRIKITDLRCAIIGRNPVVRIVTDQGISGYGQAESTKAYLKPMVLFYKDYILGEDPTDVERVMLKIRRLGAFKPWGSAVSAIEIALWDIAGQVAGVPVYKLLGGKVRDRVRIYNGGVRYPMTGQTPQDYAENMAKMKEAKEGFTLIKQAVGFHNPAMMSSVPNSWYEKPRTGASHPDRGLMTERGLQHVIA